MFYDERRMNSPKALSRLPFWLFSAGFFTVTWDTLATLELGGFTLKAHQVLFALSLLSLFAQKRQEGIASFLKPLNSPFSLSLLALAGFYIGLSPWSAFPLKSFLYSCWLIFDLLAIWLTAQHLAGKGLAPRLFQTAWAILSFLATVILVDQVAYYAFGYRGGLIGGNQDLVLNWGLSRPHAFSFEPSYIASFLSIGLVTLSAQQLQIAKRRWAFWLSFSAIAFAILATTSRTGFFSLVLGFGLIAVLPLLAGKKATAKPAVLFLGVTFLMAALFYLSTPQKQIGAIDKKLVGSIARGEDGSGNARLRAFGLALDYANETHWLGTGLAASYRYHLEKGIDDYIAPGKFSQKHFGSELIMSTWGQLLAEGGIVALLLFAFAGFSLARELLRRLKQLHEPIALGTLAGTMLFFGFSALWLGNICRGDVWVWYALWSAVAYADPKQAGQGHFQ